MHKNNGFCFARSHIKWGYEYMKENTILWKMNDCSLLLRRNTFQLLEQLFSCLLMFILCYNKTASTVTTSAHWTWIMKRVYAKRVSNKSTFLFSSSRAHFQEAKGSWEKHEIWNLRKNFFSPFIIVRYWKKKKIEKSNTI